MSRHASQSPSPGTLTSPRTGAQAPTGESHSRRVSPPLGVLELQSPVVTKCSKWIKKYKARTSKKGEVTFEIQSILAVSEEINDVIKAAIESYMTNMTLKWHQLKREEELDHTSKGVEV